MPTSTVTVPLFDDGNHNDGAMEPDGIFNNRLENLTKVEGTYHFRAVATYGEDCLARREAMWSIHVEPGIDPDRTDVDLVDVNDGPNGRQGTLIFTPFDRYDNLIGPGRRRLFTVSPLPGVVLDGQPRDNKDGTYSVDIVWDVSASPGVVIQQANRDPATLLPSNGRRPDPECNHAESAEKLLDCLGLPNLAVKRVRIKSVNLDIDLDDLTCKKEQDC